jgi:uncharacterized cupin superfamily protein
MNRILDVTGPIDTQLQHDSSVVAGMPRIGFRRLAEFPAAKVGVWEMTPGTVTDVEVDEVCFILSGTGMVIFEDGAEIALQPGSTIRLHAGDNTTWVVHETLRKIYIC